MRPQWHLAVLVVCVCVLAGCLPRWKSTPQRSWHDPFDVFGKAPTSNTVYLMTTLIDQPGGDPYLTDGLWASAERPLPHEVAALLAENGLRVGLISGIPPAEFHALVTSEKATVNRKAHVRQAKESKIVPINGPTDLVKVKLTTDLKKDATALEGRQFECGFDVTVEPADQGRVKVKILPVVQHGQKESWLKAAADGSGFLWDSHKTQQPMPALSFELVMAPGDFLVVGPTARPAETVGDAFFFVKEPGRIRQRVFVLRAGRDLKAEPLAPAVKP
jgi:hypothetical protein